MRGRTHLLLGAAVGAVVATASHEPVVPLVAAGLFGGLAPDCDHPKSLISRFLWPLWLIAPGVSRGPYHNGRRWLWVHVEWHRERVHSLAIGVVISLLGGLVWPPLGLAFLAGWASHLAIDLPQPSRLPFIFWPFMRRKLLLPDGLPAFSEAGLIDTFILEPLVMLVSAAVIGMTLGVDLHAAWMMGR